MRVLRPEAGCAPVGNACHVMQALSYVASRSPWLHTRESRLASSAKLVEPLLN